MRRHLFAMLLLAGAVLVPGSIYAQDTIRSELTVQMLTRSQCSALMGEPAPKSWTGCFYFVAPTLEPEFLDPYTDGKRRGLVITSLDYGWSSHTIPFSEGRDDIVAIGREQVGMTYEYYMEECWVPSLGGACEPVTPTLTIKIGRKGFTLVN